MKISIAIVNKYFHSMNDKMQQEYTFWSTPNSSSAKSTAPSSSDEAGDEGGDFVSC